MGQEGDVGGGNEPKRGRRKREEETAESDRVKVCGRQTFPGDVTEALEKLLLRKVPK